MDKRKLLALGILGGGGVSQSPIPSTPEQITEWQSSAERVFYGGLSSALFVSNSTGSGGASGRTWISSGDISRRIRQDGYIRRVTMRGTFSSGIKLKFKVFRVNGANYDMVSESEEITSTGTDTDKTFVLSTPMACATGDIVGVWLENSTNVLTMKAQAATTAGARYVTGDITTSDAFSSSLNDVIPCLEFDGTPPYLCVSGDSIPEGHNISGGWHSFYHLGPGGTNRLAEIAYQLRGLIDTGTLLEFQNHAMGATFFSWVASTGIVSAIAAKPNRILIHTGVNDIFEGQTWAQMESALNTIKGLLTTEILFIDEILPDTNFTDEHAAEVRDTNTKLATWCSANNATLIVCHDAMGQIRASTGELDDLKTVYNDGSGVHLSQAGVAAMAAIWKLYL